LTSPGGAVRDSLADPRRRRQLVWAVLAVLAWTALLLRWGIDSGGVLDTDAMNLGLAAGRFDILDHQPHPPGYLGYVLCLKLIHLVAPGLEAVEIAKWGTRVCGMLTVPAAYWACRQLLAPDEPDAVGRPLAAAGLAVVHPLLWYYGADGQSHAAEALVTLILFAVAFRVRRGPTTTRLMLVVALFGLAGSLRPTIPLLSSPLLVWLFWGRPLRDWALALVVGVASVAVWAAPMIALTGGWDLYQRANRALVSDVFIANYSLFSSRAHPVLVMGNIVMTLWWGAVALLPLVAWSPLRGRTQRWRRAWFALALANLLFYGLVYDAEAGYLAALAGLACLVPATWPPRAGVLLRARMVLVAVAAPALLLFGPASVPVPNYIDALMPTLAHAVGVQEGQEIYRTAVCRAADGRRAIALTDNPTTTHTRQVPMACPNIALALYIHAMPFEPRRVLDVWLIFFAEGMTAVPTGVPLEPGPPATVELPDPVDLVLLAPDASPEFKQAVLAQSSCPAETYADPDSGLELQHLPARCLPELRIGSNTIDFTAPPDPARPGGP
jgi:Protein of unknown function (DUF2723)